MIIEAKHLSEELTNSYYSLYCNKMFVETLHCQNLHMHKHRQTFQLKIEYAAYEATRIFFVCEILDKWR